MRRALACVVLTWMVVSACDKPCQPGYAKAGYDCKKLPESDAGMDSGVVQGSDGGAGQNMDGGADECLPPECDPCAMNPCANGGACETTERGYSCTCPIGFMGARCQIDPCELDPCLHDGVCKRVAEGRECACQPPWEGASCEVNTDPSLANLTVSDGRLVPSFDPEQTEYSLELGFETPSIAVTPVARWPDVVTLRVEGQPLVSGLSSPEYPLPISSTAQTLQVEVTTNAAVSRVYTIQIRRTLVRQWRILSAYPQASARFGAALAANDSYLAVGVPGLDVGQAQSVDAGAVILYIRTAEGFVEREFLTSRDRRAGAEFGSALAMDSEWLFIAGGGEVTVLKFDLVLERWQPHGRITPPEEILAFGSALAFNKTWLAVSATSTNGQDTQLGRVYLFARDEKAASGWSYSATLKADSGTPEDQYGAILAAGASSDWIAVSGAFPPRVDTWRFDGDWKRETLSAPDDLGQYFGLGAAVHGQRLVVADPQLCVLSCQGAARLLEYTRANGSWSQTDRFDRPVSPDVPLGETVSNFGLVTTLLGPTWMFTFGQSGYQTGAPGPSGVGHLYDALGGSHLHRARLTAYDDGASGLPAVSAAAAGGRLFLGANVEDTGGVTNAGAVYVFGPDCAVALPSVPDGC